MNEKTESLLEEINKKLDASIILNCVENLSGKDKINILKHSVGLKTTARILGKDRSNFKKSLKKLGNNGKEK